MNREKFKKLWRTFWNRYTLDDLDEERQVDCDKRQDSGDIPPDIFHYNKQDKGSKHMHEGWGKPKGYWRRYNSKARRNSDKYIINEELEDIDE